MTASKLPPDDPQSPILLITALRVGDALFCVPGIRLLKKHIPRTPFDVLVFSPRIASLFHHNRDVSRVVTATRHSVRRVAARYRFAIVMMHEMLKYCGQLPVPHLAIGRPDESRHRVDQVIDFVQSLATAPVGVEDRRYALYPTARDHGRIRDTLTGMGVDPDRDTLVGCQLGCHRVARRGWKFWRRERHRHKKVWPLESYVALARELQTRVPDLRIVVTGSDQERFLGRRFTSACPSAVDTTGKTSLLELAALMDRLRVLVTHDTGTLHIACARGTPLVALYGPTPVEFTGPYPRSERHTVLKAERVDDIRVSDVRDAVMNSLES